MKTKIILLFTLVSFVFVSTNCKKDEPEPVAAKITKIYFYDWVDPDEPDDSGPDVYFTIEDANGKTLYNIGSDNRIPDVEDEFYWYNLNIEINKDVKFYVRLWDYDPLDEDDDMGACGGIRFQDYIKDVNNLPDHIDVSCDNMEYRLYITWIY